MKKNLLYSIASMLTVFVFGVSTAFGQTKSYKEDFNVSVGNTPPSGWTNSNDQANTSANASWKFGNYSGSFNYDTQGTSDHTGNGSQFAWVDGSFPQNMTSILETQSYDFSNHWNLKLEFYHVSYNTTYSSSGHNEFSVDYYDGAMWHNRVFVQKGDNPSSAWTKKSIDLSQYQPQGNEQVKFRFKVNQNATTAFYNDIGIDDMEILGELAMNGMNNAATLGSVHETRCLGSQDIDVLIRNQGTNQIDSVEVHWTVDGVAQTTVHHKTLMDTLTGAPTHTQQITLGQVNFTFGIPKTIKYWTSMPNGVADTINDNDTTEFVQYAALAGKYTVGGTGSDFTSLDTLSWFLNNVGVCAPVTFEINDTMMMGKIMLDRVPGNNATNTITFTSKSGDPTMAGIVDSTRNLVTNYVVTLDTTSYVTFEDLTIENKASAGSYAAVVQLLGDASEIGFNNCIIKSGYSGSSLNACLVYSDDESISDHLLFENCDFVNGSWAIRVEGDGRNYSEDITVKDCEFIDNYSASVYIRYFDDIDLTGNTFGSNSTNTGAAAMRMEGVSGQITVYGNHVLHAEDWPRYGIYMLDATGLSNNPISISNNAFSIGDTASGATAAKQGIRLDRVAFVEAKFNTVAVASTNSSSYAFYIGNSNGNNVFNNVFANMGSGIAVSVSGLGSILSMDNNLFYSMGKMGSFNGQDQNDLADWQSNSGFDANSVYDDPMFQAMDTLKICSRLADNIGQGAGIYLDIENNLRHPNNPDPGAYEYSAISGISVEDEAICNGDTAMFFVATSPGDVLIWNNTDTGNVFSTSMAGTYSLTAFGECGADTTNFDVMINATVSLPNDTNICNGDTLMVSASVNNGIYTWSTGETGQSVYLNMPGQYYVNVVDSDGCWSTDTLEMTVSKGVELRADTSICPGTTVELNPGTPGGTYNWYLDGNAISTATKVFADSAGAYAVVFVDGQSCSSTDTFHLTHYALPNAGFTYTSNQNNVEFTADDTTGSNYYWSFGDGKSVNGTAWQTLNKYAANGTYSASLTMTSANCGNTTMNMDVELTTIGLASFTENENISIYPNPNNGEFNVDLSDLDKDLQVNILSYDGKVVFTANLTAGVSHKINVKDQVSTGVYFIQMVSEAQVVFTQKMVIK